MQPWKNLGFSEVKVTTCFNKLRAVFEKHKFSPHTSPSQRTENSTWMKVTLPKLKLN